jgi:acetyltransferase-like isoleucine patch superfamily enzyme
MKSIKKKIRRFLTFLSLKLKKNFVKGIGNVEIGENLLFQTHSIIEAKKGYIKIGNNFELHSYVKLSTYGGFIEIGNDCSCNEFCILYGHGGLKIGNSVRIGVNTVIIPADHKYSDLEKPIRLQGETRKGVTIGDNVWIGAGVIILDGVIIGNGCVIGAGSVVTKSIPSNSVVVGVPATVLKIRGE